MQRILDRAACIKSEEAGALDSVLRTASPAASEAQAVLNEHQRWKNSWAMFDQLARALHRDGLGA